MKVINVNASKKYKVTISNDLLPKIGEMVSVYASSCNACIITDDNVDAIYSSCVKKSLADAGFNVIKFVFGHGEANKTMASVNDILEFLAKHSFDRNDIIVALGGGITGDLAGFAAASYMRGIRFFQVPTTLLAAVDSSVGGKTGVNLSSGKNLAGAFWQPEAVICDIDTFKTLPSQMISEGIAEAIKCSIIGDAELYDILGTPDFDTEEVIKHCVCLKASIVEEDEKEHGKRALLNLGHTVGHAIEKCSDYKVSHGFAVAIGMTIMARASERNHIAEIGLSDKITAILKLHGLPTECDYGSEMIFEKILSDKKRRGDKITLVIPVSIGVCTLKVMAIEDALDFIRNGLE